MARKQIRVSRRMLFTWLLLGSLILLLVPQNVTNKFQFAFYKVFQWPLRMGKSISLSARVPQDDRNFVPRKQHERLQVHLNNLQAELEQTRRRLDEVSGIRQRHGLEGAAFVAADVVTTKINTLQGELTINRGQDEGLAEGQPVLADNCIIGFITEVSAHLARVRLVTDRESKIQVKIAGVDRVMAGCGGNLARVPLIQTEVEVGRGVMAAESPGFLDVPFLVGKVVKLVENDNPLLYDLTVQPICDFENLTSVTVVVMNPEQ
jgi:rod shape-determining protein MreC